MFNGLYPMVNKPQGNNWNPMEWFNNYYQPNKAQGQQTTGAGGTSFFSNPFVSLGAGLLGGIGNAFHQSPQDKLLNTQRERGDWLFDMLRNRPPQAPQQNVGQSLANTRQALSPTLNKLTWNASRFSGLSSPEAQGQIQQNYLPLEFGRANQVQDQNQQLQAQYQQMIMRLLAGLSR